MKRMACVIALATGTGIMLGSSATSAIAEPYFAAPNGLQIALAAPTLSADATTTTLDVSFKGGKIASVELYLDGTLVKQQPIHTRENKGVISFSLDGLAEGGHDVLIKAFDADGSTATATAKWKIAAADNSALNTLVGLKKGQQVQGVVPLQISIEDAIQNPYVSFYIDNDFLAMMNYAPFTYNWDSTKAANGLHTIRAEVLDGDTSRTLKTVTMEINVNNPGGYTKIHKDDKPLPAPNTKPVTPANAVTDIAHGFAESALPGNNIEPMSIAGVMARAKHDLAAPAVRSGSAPHSGITRSNTAPVSPTIGHAPSVTHPIIANLLLNTAPDTITPNTNLMPDAAALHPAATHLLPAAPTVRTAAPRTNGFTKNVAPVPNRTNAGTHLVPAVLGELASPNEMIASLNAAAPDLQVAHLALRARRAGNVAARPGFALPNNVRPAAPAPAPPVPHIAPTPAVHAAAKSIAAHPTVRVTPAAVHKAAAHKRGGRFFATFDDSAVDFDVPTRVQSGVPLTPFRQIFEHTGGTVDWNDATQTVRAVSKTHDIAFRVGSKTATVNNKKVTMESKPFVEKGRAVVPVSFVRDAMNVKVTFDPKTGHLLIESKK